MIREFLENHHGGLTMCIELGNEDRMELMTLDLGGAVHVMATRILNGEPSASGYRSDKPTHAAALSVGQALAMYLTTYPEYFIMLLSNKLSIASWPSAF